MKGSLLAENHTLSFDNKDLVPLLFGERNAHIAYLEQKLGISIADRGNRLTLSGPHESVQKAEKILNSLWDRLQKHQDVGTAEIDAALRFMNEKKNGNHANGGSEHSETVIRTRKKPITARSPNQAKYIAAIQNNPMVFGLGPAGTGKTYLAVAVVVPTLQDAERADGDELEVLRVVLADEDAALGPELASRLRSE